MAVIRSWSGAGLSPGALTTSSAGTGDTAFTSVTGSAMTVDASGPRSPQLRVTDGTGTSTANWDLPSLTAWSLRCYITKSAGAAIILQVNDAAAEKVLALDFNTSGNLRLSTRAGGTNANIWVATAAFPVDTRTRVEYTETSAGAWTAAYYNGDSTSAIGSSSGTKAAPQTATSLQLGRVSGAIASSNLYFDDVAVGDTSSALGPFSDAASTTPWFRFIDGGAVAPVELIRL